MIAAFFLHEATALWVVTYAITRRDVWPIEQHVKNFLEMIPLAALALVALLHWLQLKALLGLRVEPPAPISRQAKKPLDRVYVFGTLWRCWASRCSPAPRSGLAAGLKPGPAGAAAPALTQSRSFISACTALVHVVCPAKIARAGDCPSAPIKEIGDRKPDPAGDQ
jgi:hypothetical protein